MPFEFPLALLHIHEAPARPAALGPVFFAGHLGPKLGTLAHRAFASVVADWFVDGHGVLLDYVSVLNFRTSNDIKGSDRDID
jgi:hypothetical protein